MKPEAGRDNMFKFNLQSVLDHRQFIEDTLQKAYAHLQGCLAEAQDRLASLKRRQQCLTAEMEQKQQHGTTSSALLLYVNFLAQLKADIGRQREKAAGLEKQTAAKRVELLDAIKNRKALEKLKEKKMSAYKDKAAKKEQAFLDEIAIKRHGRIQA